VLGTVTLVLAILLAIFAAWMVVTSHTQRRIEIGILAGLWGALLGAYSMFGSRSHPRASEGVDVGGELALRNGAAVGRADDAARLHAYEQRLEDMLRHVNGTIGDEIGKLRSDVARLRSEILEKVGGQIRLERIETTRLIGSDIEALQHEVQQLKTARDGLDLGELVPRVAELVAGRVPDHVIERSYGPGPAYAQTVSIPTVSTQTVSTPAVSTPVDEVTPAAPVVPSNGAGPAVGAGTVRPAVPISRPSQALLPPMPVMPVMEPALEPEPAPEPDRAAPTVEPVRAAASTPSSATDPFADLPRLSRFTDLPVEDADSPGGAPIARPDAVVNSAPAAAPVATPGRHSAADEPSAGGRRRQKANDVDDTLAHILEREAADR
jgi:hypothetical protein